MKGPYNPLKLVPGLPESVLKRILTFGTFIFLWAWLENDKDRREQDRAAQYESPVPHFTPSEVVWTEGIKLAAALTWYFWRSRSDYQQLRQEHRDNELRSMHARDSNGARSPTIARGGGTSWRDVSDLPAYNEHYYGQSLGRRAYFATVLSLGLLHVGYAERAAVTNLFLDPMSLVLAVSSLPLLSLILVRALWSHSFANSYWLSSLLQVGYNIRILR
ncbi:hypothetical protein NEOLEDRAFT_967214 [Neolentinus lepideus HHB14362 ss-1]|uniref:Uncharacterized protein n=1 Tax=Neolentinus lepideus HHB14362 ss-1 TaxID=1314782 RepID=A0A165NCL8_9AGAM|nr:hypothetical protein NEOLEDRAFT_967214 [Neolentinus lepideus HHB14362 ss-1]